MCDAMLNADTGSPRVVRIGEKGIVWVELEATGVANHAAHVHLGQNAVDALVGAPGATRLLEDPAFSLPEAVENTIAEAKAVSEAESRKGGVSFGRLHAVDDVAEPSGHPKPGQGAAQPVGFNEFTAGEAIDVGFGGGGDGFERRVRQPLNLSVGEPDLHNPFISEGPVAFEQDAGTRRISLEANERARSDHQGISQFALADPAALWERLPCPYIPGTHSASCWSRLSTIC